MASRDIGVTRPAPVFISYSRQDYYFAESLTHHLCRLGVPAWKDVKDLVPGGDWEQQLFKAIDDCGTLLLVASPAALASPNVAAEWQRALAAGKRVLLLGWHRRARLPAALQGCEWIDFRGRFGAALHRLVEALSMSAPRLRKAGARPGRLPRLPPAVLGLLLALALPIVGYALAVAPDVAREDLSELSLELGHPAGVVLFTLFTAGMVWALCGSLLQRRMGMTRLMGCLTFVATPFALALWNLSLHGAPGLAHMPPLVAQAVMSHRPVALVLALLPLAAMAVVWWGRPEDLLRWMPTGKSWSRFRTDAVASARVPLPDAVQTLASAGAFSLFHEAADAPLAARLREELHRIGVAEVRAGDAGEPTATRIVLLSNHSTKAWLAREVQPRSARLLIPVLGSAIGPAPALEWLWKRQWIDLRRWVLQRPGGQQALPSLPEAPTAMRVPFSVARVHVLLCAYGALLALFAVALAPTDQGRDENLSMTQSAAITLAVAAAWLARQWLRRARTAVWLRRWVARLLGAGVVISVASAVMPGNRPDGAPVAWLGAALATVLAALCWRALPTAAFWLPGITDDKVPAADRLQPPGDWRTAIVFAGFMVLWAAVLNLLLPDAF